MKKMQYIAPAMMAREMQAKQLLAAVSLTKSETEVDGSNALDKGWNDSPSVWDE